MRTAHSFYRQLPVGQLHKSRITMMNPMPTKKTPSKAKKTAPKTGMTKTHKDALANGRTEGRVIREYLDIVEATKPRRGRRRTAESITKRLSVIATELKTTDAVTKVRLLQERLDLRNELASMKSKTEIVVAENKFVKVARSFSDRNEITFDAWREFGVPVAVLKKAGITH